MQTSNILRICLEPATCDVAKQFIGELTGLHRTNEQHVYTELTKLRKYARDVSYLSYLSYRLHVPSPDAWKLSWKGARAAYLKTDLCNELQQL